MSRKLCTLEINSRPVTFFTPPHSEPDFPWVDAMQLLRAFVSKTLACAILEKAQRFDDGRAVKTVRDGERLTTIMCHAMAQGLTGAIDAQRGLGDDGPAFKAYCQSAATVITAHYDLTPERVMAAYHNVGGPFFRNEREGGEA